MRSSWLLPFALLSAACGSTEPSGPGTPQAPVRVIIQTRGVDQDPDGYTLDGNKVGVNDTVIVMRGVGTSPTFPLGGMVQRCWEDHPGPWPASMVSSDTETVTVTVSCGVIATAFTLAAGQGDRFGLYNITSGQFRPILGAEVPFQMLFAGTIRWSRDRSHLLLFYPDRSVVLLDVATGGRQVLISGVDASPSGSDTVVTGIDFARTGNGFVLGAAHGDYSTHSTLYTMSGPGAAMVAVPGQEQDFEGYPAPSPTRDEIAYYGADSSGALMAMDQAGTGRHAILSGLHSTDGYLWSPDGSTIIFNQIDSIAVTTIWAIQRDGSGLAPIMEDSHPVVGILSTISGDGSTLLFSSLSGTTYYTYRIPLHGGSATALTSDAGTPIGTAAFMP